MHAAHYSQIANPNKEYHHMNKFSTLVAVAGLALTCTVPALAQSPTTSTGTMHGQDMRASKLLGTTIFDGHGEAIGTVSEIVVSSTGGETGVVVSAGKYLGTGERLVSLPLSEIKMDSNGRMAMAHASRPMVLAMPPFDWGNG